MLIRLLSALAHNGEILSKGDTINFVASEAQDLVAKGHAEAILLHSTTEAQEEVPPAGTDTKQEETPPAGADTKQEEAPLQTVPLGRGNRKK